MEDSVSVTLLLRIQIWKLSALDCCQVCGTMHSCTASVSEKTYFGVCQDSWNCSLTPPTHLPPILRSTKRCSMTQGGKEASAVYSELLDWKWQRKTEVRVKCPDEGSKAKTQRGLGLFFGTHTGQDNAAVITLHILLIHSNNFFYRFEPNDTHSVEMSLVCF